MAYYDLPEPERIALTVRALAERRSVIERWNELGSAESEPWNQRAAAAAELLGPQSAVLDLGCGTMILERYLSHGTRYLPSDITARDDRTLVCDLNQAPPPVVAASALACLGVLEYLFDPLAVMTSLAENYPAAVISYCNIDVAQPLEPRRAHAWVNDFDRAGLEILLKEAGWTIDAFVPHSDIQSLWRITSRRIKE